MKLRARIRALEALYAALPPFQCKGLCQQSCANVPMSRVELGRIKRATGKSRCLEGGRCPLLTAEGRCGAYAIRPMICRAYGMVDSPMLRCHFGCEPVVSHADGMRMLEHALEIGGGVTWAFDEEHGKRMEALADAERIYGSGGSRVRLLARAFELHAARRD